MTDLYTPRDPEFADRVRASFARQTFMQTLGAMLVRVAPGEVEIAVPRSPSILQQHGFIHGGAVSAIADTAAGYAALSLMPAGAGILTVEFKINLLAPAAALRLLASGRVIRPGRTLTVAQTEVVGEEEGRRVLVAVLTATMMAIEGRGGVVD